MPPAGFELAIFVTEFKLILHVRTSFWIFWQLTQKGHVHHLATRRYGMISLLCPKSSLVRSLSLDLIHLHTNLNS